MTALRTIETVFYKPLLENGILAKNELQSLFSNVVQLLQVNCELLEEMEKRQSEKVVTKIGDLFLNMRSLLMLYGVYCSNQPTTAVLLANLEKNNPRFREFLKECSVKPECNHLLLNDFLIQPMQRICKYPLLLANIAKYTVKEDSDYDDLNSALETIKTEVQRINERAREVENVMKLGEIQGKFASTEELDLVAPTRHFIAEGAVTLIVKHKSIENANLFLFNDILIVGVPGKKRAGYQVFRSFDVPRLGFEDSGEDEFSLTCSGQKYTLKCKCSPSDKTKWTNVFSTKPQDVIKRAGDNALELGATADRPETRTRKKQHRRSLNLRKKKELLTEVLDAPFPNVRMHTQSYTTLFSAAERATTVTKSTQPLKPQTGAITKPSMIAEEAAFPNVRRQTESGLFSAPQAGSKASKTIQSSEADSPFPNVRMQTEQSLFSVEKESQQQSLKKFASRSSPQILRRKPAQAADVSPAPPTDKAIKFHIEQTGNNLEPPRVSFRDLTNEPSHKDGGQQESSDKPASLPRSATARSLKKRHSEHRLKPRTLKRENSAPLVVDLAQALQSCQSNDSAAAENSSRSTGHSLKSNKSSKQADLTEAASVKARVLGLTEKSNAPKSSRNTAKPKRLKFPKIFAAYINKKKDMVDDEMGTQETESVEEEETEQSKLVLLEPNFEPPQRLSFQQLEELTEECIESDSKDPVEDSQTSEPTSNEQTISQESSSLEDTQQNSDERHMSVSDAVSPSSAMNNQELFKLASVASDKQDSKTQADEPSELVAEQYQDNFQQSNPSDEDEEDTYDFATLKKKLEEERKQRVELEQENEVLREAYYSVQRMLAAAQSEMCVMSDTIASLRALLAVDNN